MAGRSRNNLTAVQVDKAAPGKLSDGGGLILDRTATGGKWIFRYSFAGARREMGLGTYPAVTLAAARRARDRWEAELHSNRDPITERARQIESERIAMTTRDPTLAEVTAAVFEAKRAGLRGDGVRGRWMSPLALHVLPKLGRRRISDIHQSDVKAVIAPIWRNHHATARKAVQRLRIIFAQGRLMGYACDPFTVDAAIHMLGEVRYSPTPIPATPWQEIPALYARLDRGTTAHAALRWMILTLVRSNGARGARSQEIADGVWIVPSERMKGREGMVREFRVPLSAAAIEMAAARHGLSPTGHLFPGRSLVAAITDTALHKALREAKGGGQPHGFRTSFRTWVQDTAACTFDVAETVLAHSVGNLVERSYARSDMLEQRRAVMDRWVRFVTGAEATIIHLPARSH